MYRVRGGQHGAGGGSTRSKKLIIYNKGTEINRLKNSNGKCERRGKSTR
jgi:hypothetical protein